MAKSLTAPYEAGRRGAGWLKVKPVHTLDLVVLAVEWGSGRRTGKLSNIHLGARDPATGGFVMLGKTFKGMTDEMLEWQTDAFHGVGRRSGRRHRRRSRGGDIGLGRETWSGCGPSRWSRSRSTAFRDRHATPAAWRCASHACCATATTRARPRPTPSTPCARSTSGVPDRNLAKSPNTDSRDERIERIGTGSEVSGRDRGYTHRRTIGPYRGAGRRHHLCPHGEGPSAGGDHRPVADHHQAQDRSSAIIAVLGAVAWAIIAFFRGETVSAVWFVVAAVCTYVIGYRFYARFIEMKIVRPRDDNATPAEVFENGTDYMPTDRRVLFGHHFAAIAGAGPLVGPVLAMQMGYLPGTIWIILGAVFAGCVQDYLVLSISVRRRGRSLGQMARDELGAVGGVAAIVGVLVIMVILLAVLALVVVNALAESPWGVFSIAMTIPIALFMGLYLRFLRPGRVSEVSLIGVALLAARRGVRRLGRRKPPGAQTGSRCRRWRCRGASSSTGSPPRCCRSGCCSRPVTTCRRS